MKHGLKLRKLQRTSSHRYALLRNLVSALLHHEMIKTTVPKAKEAARMAEKIISLGKSGSDPARRAAQAFLMPSHHYALESNQRTPVAPPRPTGYPSVDIDADPESFSPPTSLLPKLFTTLADRYASRAGGYTRITRYGRRPGDHAPVALLSLVDGPRDIKFEMAARAVARETVVLGQNRSAKGMSDQEVRDRMRERTRRAVEKVLKFRDAEAKEEFDFRAKSYANALVIERNAIGHHRAATPSPWKFRKPSRTAPVEGRRALAGERFPGMSVAHTGLGLARGALGRKSGRRDARPRFVGEVLDKPRNRDESAVDISRVD